MKMKKVLFAAIATACLTAFTGCGMFGQKEKKDGPITIGINYTTAANPDDPYHITAEAFKNMWKNIPMVELLFMNIPSSQVGQ